MTTTGPSDPQASTPEPNVPPEALELRAQPRPVTRINRKVLIGAAAVVLLLIAGLVLVALRAPSLRVAAPQELFNVEHKPIADALSKLPATYDGVLPDKKRALAKEPTSGLPKGGPHLIGSPGDALDEADRAEKARLARLAVQAANPRCSSGCSSSLRRRRPPPRRCARILSCARLRRRASRMAV